MEKYELSPEEVGTIEHVIDDYASDINEQMNNEAPWSDKAERIQAFNTVHDLISIGQKLRFKSINPLLKELLSRLRQVRDEGPGFRVEE